jgi:hypothetical protein
MSHEIEESLGSGRREGDRGWRLYGPWTMKMKSVLYYFWPVEDRIYKGRISLCYPHCSLMITLVKAE